MPLAHFEPVDNIKDDRLEPIWNKLAEVHFYQDDKEIDVRLTEQLFKFEKNMMHFNLNWDSDKRETTPLDTIIKYLGIPLVVDILFHDVEGLVMYKVQLTKFYFSEIVELFNFDWNDSGIKCLDVKITYDKGTVMTHNTDDKVSLKDSSIVLKRKKDKEIKRNNLITKLFSVPIDNFLNNKYYVMKHTGMSIEEINKLPFYEFERYVNEINEKIKEQIKK